jgi:hypothetical protein
MNILITDITDMANQMHCVAGWCEDENRMVRPLPDGHHWAAQLIESLKLKTGCVVSVTPNGLRHESDLPHANEDLQILGDNISVIDRRKINWTTGSGPIVYTTLDAAFGGNLNAAHEFQGVKKTLYVEKGVNGKSLIGLSLSANQVLFTEESYEGGAPKLRAVLSVGSGLSLQRYNVAVSCTELKRLWRQSGLVGLNAHLPRNGSVHVRVGLAREWKTSASNRCAVMLNGVLW